MEPSEKTLGFIPNTPKNKPKDLTKQWTEIKEVLNKWKNAIDLNI